VGEVFIYLVPVLLGSVVESFALAEGTAGLIVALEIAASSLAAVACAAFVRRLPIRRAGMLCIALVVAGDLASAFVDELSWFIVLRVVAAFGAGALFAVANALAATTRAPEKTFSLLGMTVILAATFGFMLLTFAIERFGPQAAFAALALLSLLGAPFLAWLPTSAPIDARQASVRFPLTASSMSICMAIFLLFVGQNAVWVFVERIGSASGLPLADISAVMILNGFLSLLGPLAAHRLGNRFGRRWPIAAGMSVQVVTMIALVYSYDLTSFGASLILLSWSYVFAIPFFRAVMSSLDRTGRVAGASTAFVSVGAALGPGFGGVVLNAGGTYQSLGWIAAVLLVLTLVLVLPVARTADRLVET
jgi:predicted MFS family arabinose efflux permease